MIKLLENPHQTVRQESQFALVAMGKEAIEPLTKVAKENKNLLARIHAIWGLGMLLKGVPVVSEPLIGLLKDPEPEIRRQAAKNLMDSGSLDAVTGVIELLRDPELRVAFQAMQSIAKMPISRPRTLREMRANSQGMDEIFKLAKENANKDPYLRHAMARGWPTFLCLIRLFLQ